MNIHHRHGKIVSVTTYRDYLVAVTEDGSVWAGCGELLSPDFVWKLTSVGFT